ncbi:iron-sulfur cluster assembly accessory protein [Synechococcus sp. PCC 7335]|uniref:HesB/IscA family protein n=1 Tax=Synechococcus sp. (strain ATCC 29403 / PCC 7335) TaxID=91464 RepID=UPI000571C2B8|nr:iron-sulfur cluster assembly accessory protein [Synechococcus sp. PCC 7335]
MIQLTAAACQEIDRLRRRQNQPDAICRLDLQPSSCAKWAYALSLESAIGAQDNVYNFSGIQLVVERSLLSHIQGLVIDFAEDLIGGAFRFDNPCATESCRCGAAFAIRQRSS